MVRFFVISDLHLGKNISIDKATGQLKTLCDKIQVEFSPKETVLFIIMGDIINASDTSAFEHAKICLNCIREELYEYTVHFEFVPGNHDIMAGDISQFDRFIAEYGASCPFGGTAAYSKIYDNVNFIFADSNLLRNHRLPGKIDLDAVRGEVKHMENLLFCHHGFTHSFGGDHDVIDNGESILTDLWDMGIRFAIHGHTHRSDITISQGGIVELGCGALFKDVSDMEGIQNQFSVGHINDGHMVSMERFIVSKDGGGVFPSATLYPKHRTFSNTSDIGKCMYNAVTEYIPRNVRPHSYAIKEEYKWLHIIF